MENLNTLLVPIIASSIVLLTFSIYAIVKGKGKNTFTFGVLGCLISFLPPLPLVLLFLLIIFLFIYLGIFLFHNFTDFIFDKFKKNEE